MKRLIVFIMAVISSWSAPLHAQEGSSKIITEKFTVAGNCGMCKQRIEDAAYGKGVKNALWDKSTGTLTVTYHGSKTNGAAIRQRIALAGHDADTFRAPEPAYLKLPECCSYKTHPGH